MSKTTLPYLQYEIKTESQEADRAAAEIEALEKAITAAMDDPVGYRARTSAASIRRSFSCHMQTGLRSAEGITQALETGYQRIDRLLADSERIFANASAAAKGVGEL